MKRRKRRMRGKLRAVKATDIFPKEFILNLIGSLEKEGITKPYYLVGYVPQHQCIKQWTICQPQ